MLLSRQCRSRSSGGQAGCPTPPRPSTHHHLCIPRSRPKDEIPVVFFVYLAATLDNWDPGAEPPRHRLRQHGGRPVMNFDQCGLGPVWLLYQSFVLGNSRVFGGGIGELTVELTAGDRPQASGRNGRDSQRDRSGQEDAFR